MITVVEQDIYTSSLCFWGQYLVAKLYAFQANIPPATESYTARQMPAFWLNGSIT